MAEGVKTAEGVNTLKESQEMIESGGETAEEEETDEEIVNVGEEPANLDSLPAYELYHVCQYLTDQDMLSLFWTCHRLRATLNDNYFWSTHDGPYPGIGALWTTEQNVAGAALGTLETLPPLCDNLMSCLGKRRLSNNWRSLNAVVSPVTELRETHFLNADLHLSRNSNLFYDNRYLVMSGGWECTDIRVWDLNDKPKVVASLPLNEIDSRINCEAIATVRCGYVALEFSYFEQGFVAIHVTGEHLVVALGSRAYMYQIDIENEQLRPKTIVMIRGDSVIRVEDDVERDNDGDKWWEELLMHAFSGDYMMSTDKREPVLHVWNLVQATKIGSFSSPVPGRSYLTFHSLHKNKWIFRQNHNLPDITILFFDLKEKNLIGPVFSMYRYEHVIFHDDMVILFRDEFDEFEVKRIWFCYVLPFHVLMAEGLNLQRAIVRRFEEIKCVAFGEIQSIKVVGGKFYYVDQGVLHLVEAKTLETVYMLDLKICDSAFISHFLEVFGVLFLAYGRLTSDSHYSARLCNVVEKNHLDIIFGTEDENVVSVYTNPSRSKMVVFTWKSLRVVHFW